jgi:carbonic anhydrase/acetyltransferase-like protein (isoleucine patch superfamily)
MKNILRFIQRKKATLLLRFIQRIRIYLWKLVSTNSSQGNPQLAQPVQWVGKGEIVIHENVKIGFWPSPYCLGGNSYFEARFPEARIEIGEGTVISNNFVCIAEYSSIFIGRKVLIGTNVEIINSDFHGIEPSQRSLSKPEWNSPVEIADNVFIGSNVRILKGVKVGKNVVIANSAVVTKDVAENSVVAGIPAKVVHAFGNN